jgi:NO-binding membrane sensor protein with MHYT domain
MTHSSRNLCLVAATDGRRTDLPGNLLLIPGTTGIWVMHFIAMLGCTIPGQVIHYSVVLTIASMLIAVLVVGIGLLIVGLTLRSSACPS